MHNPGVLHYQVNKLHSTWQQALPTYMYYCLLVPNDDTQAIHNQTAASLKLGLVIADC